MSKREDPDQKTTECLADYYKCPAHFLKFAHKEPLPSEPGYFRFGDDAVCFGKCYGQQPRSSPTGPLSDLTNKVEIDDGTVYLPFDPSEVVESLRSELYVRDWRDEEPVSVLAAMYYFVRPILPVGVRKYLQKAYLRDWNKIPFPAWPVATSVDSLLHKLLLFSLRASGAKKIPFIWFWPEGRPACAIVTHDVETAAGRDFCSTLMDIDDSFGVKASFQVIPEERYVVEPRFLASIRERGFEVLVHDLNHDGHLYKTKQEFLKRAAKINAYRKEYGAEGFRAGVLYRRQLWYDALDFGYDMSVPNVAHLDPQRGGCCTVMPYFIGKLVELPVTTIQDYSLFNILNDYSTDLWKAQMQVILRNYGLMSFIVHPDYVAEARERETYKHLLGQLASLREKQNIWIPTPGEVHRWWRQRAAMRLVETQDGWKVEGDGAERACIAYASEENGSLRFTFQGRLAMKDLNSVNLSSAHQ